MKSLKKFSPFKNKNLLKKNFISPFILPKNNLHTNMNILKNFSAIDKKFNAFKIPIYNSSFLRKYSEKKDEEKEEEKEEKEEKRNKRNDDEEEERVEEVEDEKKEEEEGDEYMKGWKEKLKNEQMAKEVLPEDYMIPEIEYERIGKLPEVKLEKKGVHCYYQDGKLIRADAKRIYIVDLANRKLEHTIVFPEYIPNRLSAGNLIFHLFLKTWLEYSKYIFLKNNKSTKS